MTESLSFAVGNLFNESQHHKTTHRRNIHSLLSIFRAESNSIKGDGENAFFTALASCLFQAISVRRHEELVGRVMRFVVGFIVCAAEQAQSKGAIVDEIGSPTSFLVELAGPVSRMIGNLMRMSLECLDCKEKQVRVRMMQILVACINVLDELEDDIMATFQLRVPERLFDREAAVRVQAVHAVSRLQEMPLVTSAAGASDDGGIMLIQDVLLDLLQHDGSADVRKAVLEQISVNERTIDGIVPRMRDIDASIRRFFFQRKLSEIPLSLLTGPRRNLILSGLFDRDALVRRACVEGIFQCWIPGGGVTTADPIGLVQLLDFRANPAATETALFVLFEATSDEWQIRREVKDLAALEQWDAFFLRTYCRWVARVRGPEAVQEAVLPELVVLVEASRQIYQELIGHFGNPNSDLLPVIDALETVLGYLLETTVYADSSDEVGRRTMRDLLEELLMNMELGEGLIAIALRMLQHHTAGQSEFISLASQIIVDYRDVFDPTGQVGEGEVSLNQSFESLTEHSSADRSLRLAAYQRALDIYSQIVGSVLVGSSFEAFPELAALRDLIVIPAVNSGFAVIQAGGLRALGLSSLGHLETAKGYLELFLDFLTVSQDQACQVLALKILFDVIMVWGEEVLPPNLLPLEKMSAGLCSTDPAVLCVAAEGFAKLLLNRRLLIPGNPICEAVLEGLLLLHFYPTHSESPNQNHLVRLRQVLAYFFPAYAHSRLDQQLLLAKVAVSTVLGSSRRLETPKETIPVIVNQLVYLCDPSNNLMAKDAIHIISPLDKLAIELCWHAIKVSFAEDSTEVRALLMVLSKMPSPSTARSAKILVVLVKHLIRANPLVDKTCSNALDRYLSLLVKREDEEAGEWGEEPEILAEWQAEWDRLQSLTKASTINSSKPVAPLQKKRTTKTVGNAASVLCNNILDDLDDILDGDAEN